MKTLFALIAAASLTAHAAPIIGRGTPPGSCGTDPWPVTCKTGRIYYGLMETRNGVSAVTLGWYDTMPQVCGIHEQEALRNAGNWWAYLTLQYRAEMVWVIVAPGESRPSQVGGNPLMIN